MTPVSIVVGSDVGIELEEFRFGRFHLLLSREFGRRRGELHWSIGDTSRFEEEVDPLEGGDRSSVHGGEMSVDVRFERTFSNQVRVMRREA